MNSKTVEQTLYQLAARVYDNAGIKHEIEEVIARNEQIAWQKKVIREEAKEK